MEDKVTGRDELGSPWCFHSTDIQRVTTSKIGDRTSAMPKSGDWYQELVGTVQRALDPGATVDDLRACLWVPFLGSLQNALHLLLLHRGP